MRKIVLAPLLALLVAACAPSHAQTDAGLPPLPAPPWNSKLKQDNPLVGTIWDTAAKRAITPAQLVERLTAAELVLLGEAHDNLDHHRLQAWLVQALVAKGRKPALAMEMIEPAQGDKLAAHLAEKPADAAGLGEAIGWSKGWPEWPIYAPIVEPVVKAGLPVLPANVDRTVLRDLVRSPEPLEDKELKAGLLPAPPEVAEALAKDIREGHCNMLPEAQVPSMALTQRARDRAMARAMVDGLKRPGVDQAVLIAGAGHVRRDIAVPFHLRDIARNRPTVTVSFIEASDSLDGHLSEMPYDIVWVTPRDNETDHCAELQKQMEQIKKQMKKAE